MQNLIYFKFVALMPTLYIIIIIPYKKLRSINLLTADCSWRDKDVAYALDYITELSMYACLSRASLCHTVGVLPRCIQCHPR